MNKSGVISFFQELFFKKVVLRSFSGNYSNKKWSYVVFLGNTLKKVALRCSSGNHWRYVVIPGKC